LLNDFLHDFSQAVEEGDRSLCFHYIIPRFPRFVEYHYGGGTPQFLGDLNVYIVRPLRRNDGMVMSYATEYYKRHAVIFTRWSNAIPTSAPEPKTEDFDALLNRRPPTRPMSEHYCLSRAKR
jgi:hypothetical protein